VTINGETFLFGTDKTLKAHNPEYRTKA